MQKRTSINVTYTTLLLSINTTYEQNSDRLHYNIKFYLYSVHTTEDTHTILLSYLKLFLLSSTKHCDDNVLWCERIIAVRIVCDRQKHIHSIHTSSATPATFLYVLCAQLIHSFIPHRYSIGFTFPKHILFILFSIALYNIFRCIKAIQIQCLASHLVLTHTQARTHKNSTFILQCLSGKWRMFVCVGNA